MHELRLQEFGAAWPLFTKFTYSHVFFRAVQQGFHKGRLFVDNAVMPQSAMLWTACDFQFFVGDPTDFVFLDGARSLTVSELTPVEGYVFLMPESKAWSAALKTQFGDYPQTNVVRKVYKLDEKKFRTLGRRQTKQLPVDLHILPYNRAIAAAYRGIEPFWGSIDKFLAEALGVAVFQNDRLVAQCHAMLRGGQELEISVETQEAFRRQGLGRLACRAFIAESLGRGLQPVWSCWQNNEASTRLAADLGFEPQPDVPVILIYTQL